MDVTLTSKRETNHTFTSLSNTLCVSSKGIVLCTGRAWIFACHFNATTVCICYCKVNYHRSASGNNSSNQFMLIKTYRYVNTTCMDILPSDLNMTSVRLMCASLLCLFGNITARYLRSGIVPGVYRLTNQTIWYLCEWLDYRWVIINTHGICSWWQFTGQFP